MEYTNIINLVPAGEHFDASAVNEGVWVSVAHLNNIENTLVEASIKVDESTEQNRLAIENLEAANLSVQQATAAMEEKDNTIASLQQQIEILKAGPAAAIQQTAKEKDDQPQAPAFESEVTKEANRLRALRNKK